MTQRTRIFYNYFKNWGSFEYDSIFFEKKWLSELNSFQMWLKKIELFFFNVTRRIESFSLRLKELNPFFLISLWELNFFNTTQKLTQKKYDCGFCFLNMTQKNCFFEYDSTNWTFFRMTPSTQLLFFKMTLRTELFFDMTQRNWTFFCIWIKELNFFTWLKELKFFNMTRRIEPF